MAKQVGEKFTWVIKDFCSLQSKTCESDIYEIGGCNCFLSADVLPNNPEILYVRLMIISSPSLLTERRRYVKYRLTLVNQLSENLSMVKEGLDWFDSPTVGLRFASLFTFPKVHDKYGGFLVNDEVKIVVEVDVLEVIDNFDIREKFEKTTRIREEFEKTTRIHYEIDENNSDDFTLLFKEVSTIKESIDVNGFQVFPSQVESVRRIFEKHPDIAIGFRAKNQHLRNSCMFSLLSIIDTLCKSFQELSNEDLVEADIAMKYVKEAGFKVDWLEKKLDKVKGKKETEQKELLLASITSLSFDDVV